MKIDIIKKLRVYYYIIINKKIKSFINLPPLGKSAWVWNGAYIRIEIVISINVKVYH